MVLRHLHLLDMTDKLTIKEQTFVAKFMESGKKNDAYACAYNAENMKQATIDNRAYELSNKPRVKREIEGRRAALTERCQVTQIRILQGYFKIIDDYNEGIRLAKSKKKADNSASYRIANFVNGSHVVAALKAIAEMTGLTAPKADAINNGIIINYINPQ